MNRKFVATLKLAVVVCVHLHSVIGQMDEPIFEVVCVKLL
jgi:hypothetical protein